MAQSTPREPKVPHHNLIEVSGPSVPANSDNIAQKLDECVSLEIPIEQQEINICTGQEEKPNKAENNTEHPREPSVRPKNWGRNRYRYNNEFRENNFTSEYRRGSQVLEVGQSRYQERSSFQSVAPREEQEEEFIIPNRRSRYQPSSFQTVAPREEQEEEPIIPNRRNRYCYNNEFRQNNFSRYNSRGSQVPEVDQSRYQERSSVQTVTSMEEQEEELITPKRKNRNRRSKQTLRLQRLLIQPQWNDESESTEDDSDEDILMSQLNPIPT
ncbi:hypothetical protein WMY93_003802 [Mugilogobius chulae]|uniref:Uncharacterized protein n=1 Tax=Mugilogobius chulae TaxID=88201 RepID=A0AAW0QCQ6_9GOBI